MMTEVRGPGRFVRCSICGKVFWLEWDARDDGPRICGQDCYDEHEDRPRRMDAADAEYFGG